MAELALTRAPGDRRRFDLAGYGSLRKVGTLGRSAELAAQDGELFRTQRRGLLHLVVGAVDADGAVIGEYRSRPLRSAGDVTWRGTEFDLRTERWWSSRFLLSRDGQPVLRLRGRGWGRTPVRLVVEDPTTDAGLVLFTAWVVQAIIAESSSGSAAAS